MLGFIADYAFLELDKESGAGWRLMLGLGMVMPLILIVLTCTVMPESPRWLLMKDRREEAIAVLKRTYPHTTDFEHLAEEISDVIKADFDADHGSTWHAILRPSPAVVLMLLAGVGLAACQPLTGIESFSELAKQRGGRDWVPACCCDRPLAPIDPTNTAQCTSRKRSCARRASARGTRPSASPS